MMLSKTLVSFIAAFGVATGVSAAATPEVRGDSSPPVINQSQCNVGSVSCCNTVTTSNNPFVAQAAGLLGIPLDIGGLVGLSCLNLLGSTQCTASPVCCSNVNQYGLINLGCSPLNLGL